MYLLLVLIAVPIIEIALFIEVGGWLGLWPTLAIVILTAMAGAVLLRRQGFGVLASLQQDMARGGDPTRHIAHGAMILIAGVLLLTPGFFTDAVGFLLLTPPVRAAIIRTVGERIRASGSFRVHTGATAGPGGGRTHSDPRSGPRPDVVDGEFHAVDPDADLPDPGPDSPNPRSGWRRD